MPPGHDRRNRGGEGQQEKEAHERVAVVFSEEIGAVHELHAVGDFVADEEVRQRRDRKIDEDLDERIDLVFLADGPEFEEREAGVHREHHGGAQQEKKRIGSGLKCLHGSDEGKKDRSICKFRTNDGAFRLDSVRYGRWR